MEKIEFKKLTKLQRAVIKQLGYVPSRLTKDEKEELATTLRDVSNHGASGGVSHFIYYNETMEFYRKNKQAIVEELKERASDAGMSTIQVAMSFNCLADRQKKTCDYSEDEIGRVLYGTVGKDDVSTMIANALAWFALETVANQLINQ